MFSYLTAFNLLVQIPSHINVKSCLKFQLSQVTFQAISRVLPGFSNESRKLFITFQKKFFRSSRLQMFFEIGIHKISQHSQESTCFGVSSYKSCSPETLQLYQKETPTQMFSCEYCEIFKSRFFKEHLRATAFGS